MGKKKTQEEVVKEIFDLVGDNFIVTSQYTGAKAPLIMKSVKCGHEFPITFSNFKKTQSCSKCAKNYKKTHEDFVNEVFEATGYEYTVIGQYSGADTGVLVRHNVCGKEHEMMPSNFSAGKRCRICSNMSMNKLEFVDKVKELYSIDFTVLSDFTGIVKPVNFRHETCGREFHMIAREFLNGRTCVPCNRKARIKRNEPKFIKMVKDMHGDEYSVIGEYNGSNEPVLMKHNECGHEWSPLANSIKQGSKCPRCNNSKGELAVKEFLEKHGIKYEREYIFKDLFGIGGDPLRFDFAIFLDREKPTLIEYNGQFHYKKLINDEIYERQLIHDDRKKSYCLNNGISMITIPFWDYDNINEILEFELLGVAV